MAWYDIVVAFVRQVGWLSRRLSIRRDFAFTFSFQTSLGPSWPFGGKLSHRAEGGMRVSPELMVIA